MGFWNELKKRNVFRVGAAYAVAAWFVLQLLDVLGEILELPSWIGQLVLAAVIIGFFLALVLAWAFELTPEGIRPEGAVERTLPVNREAGKKLDRIIIALLGLVVAGFLFDEFYLEPRIVVDETVSGAETPMAMAQASIAVLPFEDLSPAGDQGWFADGLAEEILTSLSRVPSLQVSPRTASFRYRDSDLPLERVASELGVGYLLAGSVRSSDERIRVSAQLIRTSDGFQAWSDGYDRDPAELISIQQDLARSIAEALEINLDPNALAAMIEAGTQSTEAYRAYLTGISLEGGSSTRPREQVLLEVRAQFEKAIAADPEFGDAWYRLANWWLADLMPTSVFNGLSGLSPEDANRAFNRAINQAIEHAADRADQHGYRALKSEVAGRLREAVERYRAFVDARPNSGSGWSGLTFAALKASDDAQLDRALDWLRNEGERNLSAAITYVGNAYQHHDPSQVADYALERLEDWPDVQVLLYQAHRALLWAGRVDEAAAVLWRINDEWPSQLVAALRQACAEGRVDDAEAIWRRSKTKGAVGTWIVLKTLGREDEASEALIGLVNSELPFRRSTPLAYRIFDPTPFPSVMALLDREQIQRPPPLKIPFRCGAA